LTRAFLIPFIKAFKSLYNRSVSDRNDANPFTPTFGRSPSVVVGRQETLEVIRRALVSDADPARKTLLRAHRGSGKTVLLNEIQDLAAALGWLVIQEDAAETSISLIDRLMDRVGRPLDGDQKKPRRKLSSVNLPTPLGGIGASLESSAPSSQTRTLRTVLEQRFSSADVGGILLSIDEIHEARSADLKEIGNAVQQLDRDGWPIAVALAGLPLTDDEREPTFLSRCWQPDVGVVEDEEISRGLTETADRAKWKFSPTGLSKAIDVAAGYPYMLQLIGWEAFEQARQDSPGVIDLPSVEAATDRAHRRLNKSVLSRFDQKLTSAEIEFLFAMAEDLNESKMSDIVERTEQTPQYANVYRERLLEAGLIKQVSRGFVDFVVPGHRAYLRSDQAYAASRSSKDRRRNL
jgi:AAA ATPase domain